MARLFLMDTGSFAVWDSDMDAQPDPVSWTRLARYNETEYPVLHQKLSDNVKNATWNAETRELTINGVVEVNSVWIDAAEAAITAAIADEQTDASERATLLQQAEAALNQIESDKAAVATGKTAAAAATTLAQMRQIVLGILDVKEHQLNREERVIKALRAIIRSGNTQE